MKEQTTFGLLIERNNNYGTDSIEIRVMARENGADYPINPRSESINSSWENTAKVYDGLYLNGLTLRGHVYDSREIIGFAPQYIDASYLDLRDVKGMQKTLAKLEKAFSAAHAESDIGDAVDVFARTLKLSFVAERVNENKSSLYSNDTWRFIDIGFAKGMARDIARDMIRDAKESAA